MENAAWVGSQPTDVYAAQRQGKDLVLFVGCSLIVAFCIIDGVRKVCALLLNVTQEVITT